jgi:ABC-type branched-subunit amino acid transport system substrate-binding protein
MLAAAALLATACSSSGGNKAGGNSANQKFTGTIKIGTTIWNTSAAVLNERYPGIKAAIRAINAQGGVNGKQLVWDDCEGVDPNSLDACGHKMVSDGVVATVGDSTLIDEASYGDILAKAGIPEIDPFVIINATYSDTNDFLLSGGTPTQFAAVTTFMKQLGLKTYHFVAGISPVTSTDEDIVRAGAQVYGLQEKGAPTAVPLTAADFTPYVADASAAGAQINIPIMSPFMTNLLVKATQQLGKKLPLGMDNQFTPADAQQFGQAGGPLDGAILTDAVPPVSETGRFPALKTYQQDLAAEGKSGDALVKTDGQLPLALLGWLDVKVIAEVMKGLSTVTAATVKQGFATAKNLNTFGLTPPWTPSAQGPAGYSRISNPWEYLITIKNGKIALFQSKPVNALIPMAGIPG